MTPKKILGWIIVILIVFFIITQPTAAAHVLQNIGSILVSAFNAFISFFTQLF